MNEFGQVVKINGNIASVKFIRSSACGKCTACGMSANQQEIMINVINTNSASIGQMVNVKIDSKKALFSSAVAYVFPLIMLVAGVGLGYILAGKDIIMSDADMLGAILGLGFTGGAFLIIELLEKFFKKKIVATYKMI